MSRLFCFGLGYTATAAARAFRDEGWSVAGTCRSPEKAEALRREGIEATIWSGAVAFYPRLLDGATHLLSSVPPDAEGDPVARRLRNLPFAKVVWAGYLSATSVYGDMGGARVDEATPPRPSGERGRRRIAAERDWLALVPGLPVHLFRLAGIYGPGRSAVDQVRNGTARRIHKPGHLFSRIHVDDIVRVLRASMARPDPGAIYNVCDDEPAESAEVVAHACALLGVAPPPLVPFAEADLSPAARAFYDDDKRCDNARIKRDLGVVLAYPDYRRGLAAVLAGSGETG